MSRGTKERCAQGLEVLNSTTIGAVMEDLRLLVGQRIVALREEVGFSQERLAEAAGMSRRFLGALERGERAATVDTLERLGHALRVPVRRLVEEDEPGEETPADRLARLVSDLSSGVAAEHLSRVERLLKAYFADVQPPPKKRKGRPRRNR